MLKRKSSAESPRASKRRQITPADEPEEGELSDSASAKKSEQANGRASSDTEDSPSGFAKIPLPFKSKAKAEQPQISEERAPRPTGYRERSRSQGPSSPPRHDRRGREDDDTLSYRNTRRSRSRSRNRERAYRDDDSHYNRYSNAPQRWRSDYDDGGHWRGGDRYVPDEEEPRFHRKRSASRTPSRSPRSHTSHQLHRLPPRRSPSPVRRRRDEDYRPRSPESYYYPPDDRNYPRYEDRPPYDAYDSYRRPESPRQSPRLPALPSGTLPNKPGREILTHPNANSSSTWNSQHSNDGKLRIIAKPRTSLVMDPHVISRLDPDVELPPHRSSHTAGANFSPLQNERSAQRPEPPFTDGKPPPPSEAPPPIPPPLKSKPIPPYPGAGHERTGAPGMRSPSKIVEVEPRATSALPPNGTKAIRSREDEMDAYGRNFVGVDKISDFELLNKVGEGTFGEVHKARRKGTNQVVALKRILMKNETEGVPITALREIKILKKLKHPSVVSLVSMIVQRQQRSGVEASIYMVFPFMDHDLSGLLENPNVRLSISQIKLYMKQLCEGVGYLHRNKILHRDLKSANLLINNEGCLQIADFGLARPVSHISHSSKHREREDGRSYTNSVVTRWYRSPELLLGSRKYEGWVDMWGVGCIFAEMFQRKPIMPGTSDPDQLTKIFQLCGSPNEENFPGWNKFDPKSDFPAHWLPSQRQIRSVLPDHATNDTVDFLDRLLTLDPHRRITAYESLDHDYFWTEPLPADPKSLAKYESSHEFNRRRVPQNAPQHAALPVSHMQQGPQFYSQAPVFFPSANAQQNRGNLPNRANGYVQQPWAGSNRGPPHGGAQANGHRGGPPPLNRAPPFNAPAPLPPIHLAPGRPPPPMYMNPGLSHPSGSSYPPAPPYSSSGRGRDDRAPRPRSRERRDRPEWDRERERDWRREPDDRDRRPPPPSKDELSYG